MNPDWLEKIIDTSSSKDAWDKIFKSLLEIALNGSSPVAIHDSTVIPDRILAEAAWELWEEFPCQVERTSFALKKWCADPSPAGKAVLIMDALSLRELSLILGGAKARNINILGEVSAIEAFIQTDAVVNRGNSGGALVNTNGDLVGINAAIASNTGSYTGYSFAIPVNIVKKVVEDIKDFGEIQRAYLGISFREIDSQFAEEMGLDEIKGVYVVEVIKNGAAADAGIEKGDVIVRVNNTDINSKSSLLETIGTQRPGDQVKVYVKREDNLKEYIVVLKNRSGNTDIVKKDNIEVFGATFKAISQNEMEDLNISYGLKIIFLGSGRLKSAGIREGFIVMFIDKEPVKSVDDLKYILDSKKGGTLIEGIYPSGQKAYYGVGL